MCAGYDYNPTLLNLQCLILGLKDLTLKFKKKKNSYFCYYTLTALSICQNWPVGPVCWQMKWAFSRGFC